MNLPLLVFIVFSLGKTIVCRPSLEPKCSRFDYEEKMLEKMVRMEHANEQLFDNVKEFTDQTKNRLESVEKGLEDNSANIASLKERSSASFNSRRTHGTYAFSAYFLTDRTPTKNEAVVFTKTLFDRDGVYNNSTGKFTAPVDGVYLFTASLCTPPNKDVWLHFVADGTKIGALMTGDKYWNTCSSGSAITFLSKRSNVWLSPVSVSSGISFNNNEQSYFNGFAGALLQMADLKV